MRNRIKISRICSSDNYKQSMNTHREILKDNHESNKEFLSIAMMSVSTKKNSKVGKKAYTMCYGKEIEIPTNIALNMSSNINIIWK